MKKLKNFKKKLKFIYQMLSYDDFELSAVIHPEEELKGIILKELSSVINSDKVSSQHLMFDTVDKIVSNIFNKKNKEEKLNAIYGDIFTQQRWNYTIVAGFACLWEMQVQMLGARLGIQVTKPYENRNKKQRKTKMITYISLESTIRKINTYTNNSLDLKLLQLAELRSALVHGNLDQLRILLNNCNHKYKQSHRGNVVVFNPSYVKEIHNLSNDLDAEVREKQDIWSWFIEGTNSTLLEDVWDVFSESIGAINNLIEFHVISLNDRKKVFEQIITGKRILSNNDIELYDLYLSQKHLPKRKAKNFFANLNNYFQKDIMKEVIR